MHEIIIERVECMIKREEQFIPCVIEGRKNTSDTTNHCLWIIINESESVRVKAKMIGGIIPVDEDILSISYKTDTGPIMEEFKTEHMEEFMLAVSWIKNL